MRRAKPQIVRSVPFAIALAAIFLSGCARESDRGSAQPEPAPELTLVTLAGDTTSLAARQGEVVLLNIWATWCAPCREEIPALQRLHAADSARGLRVVGVSIDARGEENRIKNFLADFGVTYPIWLDPDERSSFVFRAVGVPASYLINRRGDIVWKQLGPLDEKDPSLKKAIDRALAAAR